MCIYVYMWELDVVFGTWCALSLLLLSFCTFLTKFRKLVQLWWCWLLLFLWCSRCYLCSRWEKKNCHVFEVRYVSKKVSHWCSFSWILWLLVFFKVISVFPLFFIFQRDMFCFVGLLDFICVSQKILFLDCILRIYLFSTLTALPK